MKNLKLILSLAFVFSLINVSLAQTTLSKGERIVNATTPRTAKRIAIEKVENANKPSSDNTEEDRVVKGKKIKTKNGRAYEKPSDRVDHDHERIDCDRAEHRRGKGHLKGKGHRKGKGKGHHRRNFEQGEKCNKKSNARNGRRGGNKYSGRRNRGKGKTCSPSQGSDTRPTTTTKDY